MSSVLGKRQRSSDSQNLYSTRSKRQSVAKPLDIHNDENRDPWVHTAATVLITTPKRASTATRPSKHVTPKSATQATPTATLNSHFSISKPSPSLLSKSLEPLDTENASKLKTPRHRDTAKVVISPSQCVITPRGLRTPRTPKTPRAHDIVDVESVYTRARQVFLERSNITTLVGRDDERTRLSTFVSDSLAARTGGCLYVSGPPGTGKSAFISLTLDRLKSTAPFKSATINCMSVKTIRDLVKRLADDLELDTSDQSLDGLEALKFHLTSSSNTIAPQVIVLDEIDRLIDLDIKALYSLFEWAMQPDSKIILIGIANALDLTDRLLPRLKSRNIKPDLLPFMPYTDTQIEQILTSKLRSLAQDTSTTYIPIIHPSAIILCSKKVAANTGDVRKAFDICARAIDLIEQETRTQQSKLALAKDETPTKATPLKENPNLSSPSKTPRQLRLSSNLSHLTYQTAPRATIAHMARITASIFSNGTTQRLATLNMQQKAVLYALSGLEEQRRTVVEANKFSTPSKRHGQNNVAPTVRQLYGVYSALCKRDDSPLHPLTSVEFRDVLGGLETLSLVTAVVERAAGPITPSRTPSRRRKTVSGNAVAGTAGAGGFSSSVGSGNSGLTSAADDRKWSCCVGKQELTSSLNGPGSDLLKSMLEGVDLLGM